MESSQAKGAWWEYERTGEAGLGNARSRGSGHQPSPPPVSLWAPLGWLGRAVTQTPGP